MINATAAEKVRNFYKAVFGMQDSGKKEPALLVVKKESTGDIVGLAPNSNLTTVIDLEEGTDSEQIIDQLADAMRAGRIVLIRLHEFLEPKIYNQLFLLSKDGHMEFPSLEGRVFVDAAKDAKIIIISTDAELEKLNYSNLFDLIGLTERL